MEDSSLSMVCNNSHVWLHILSYLNDPGALARLRITCREMYFAIPVAPPTVNKLLWMSALAENIEWCNIAIAWGANCDEALWRAAAAGHVEICRIAAKYWKVSIAGWDETLRAAARVGEDAICHIAKENGAYNFEGMLISAARGNQRSICFLARSWGARNYKAMREAAGQFGNKDLCYLGTSWMQAQWTAMKQFFENGGLAGGLVGLDDNIPI